MIPPPYAVLMIAAEPHSPNRENRRRGQYTLFSEKVNGATYWVPSIAAFFGTKAVAKLNTDAARDVARINASAQLRLERQKDRRQWRRDRAAQVLNHLSRTMRLQGELLDT